MWGHRTKHKRPMTLGRSFARSTGPLLGFAGFALAFLVLSSSLPQGGAPPTGREVSEPSPSTSDTVERLVRRHDCWTGEAPAEMEGELPGHVVYTPADATQPRLGGQMAVGRALEHVFEGRHPGLRVHAFCR